MRSLETTMSSIHSSTGMGKDCEYQPSISLLKTGACQRLPGGGVAPAGVGLHHVDGGLGHAVEPVVHDIVGAVELPLGADPAADRIAGGAGALAAVDGGQR